MNTRDVFAAVFLAVIGVFLIFSVLATHPFGSPESHYDADTQEFQIIDPEMDEYIINNCQEETGADNSVTSVVFDYRGFDTLGEATVLFTAVAGVIVIFRRTKK
jgi:multisubunit Na+/H+ antiporter MnhB subunit